MSDKSNSHQGYQLSQAEKALLSHEQAGDGTANPLRDAVDRRLPRIAGPCGLVMFGVTGDLSRKKLMPAIYDLANRGLLPPGFALVGFARRDWADQDFAEEVHLAVKEHARTPYREEVWRQLSEGFRFVSGEFGDKQAFVELKETIDALARGRLTEEIDDLGFGAVTREDDAYRIGAGSAHRPGT